MGRPKTFAGGKLIVFEGLDGTGKSTQLALIKDYLTAAGWQVATSRNLGGTPIGEQLRGVILSDTPRPALTDLYISVAIQAALAEALKGERQKGSIILLDRSPLSMAAYESHGSGVSAELAWHYADEYIEQFKPDLIIFYVCPIKTALQRAKKAKSDYFESKPIDYFERVARGLEDGAKRYDAKAVDASGTIDEVFNLTIKQINHLLKA